MFLWLTKSWITHLSAAQRSRFFNLGNDFNDGLAGLAGGFATSYFANQVNLSVELYFFKNAQYSYMSLELSRYLQYYFIYSRMSCTYNRTRRPPETKLWFPPAFVTQFGAHFRFCKTKTIDHTGKSMKQNSNLNHFKQLLFHTFPPLMSLIFLVLQKRKQAPKPLLARQNWVT